MVSGDVFRAPKDSLLLCVEVGSGVQIVSSAFITLVFAALGAPPDALPSGLSSSSNAVLRCSNIVQLTACDGQLVCTAQASCRRPAAARC